MVIINKLVLNTYYIYIIISIFYLQKYFIFLNNIFKIKKDNLPSAFTNFVKSFSVKIIYKNLYLYIKIIIQKLNLII